MQRYHPIVIVFLASVYKRNVNYDFVLLKSTVPCFEGNLQRFSQQDGVWSEQSQRVQLGNDVFDRFKGLD